MKLFMYFESQEGGMCHFEVRSEKDLEQLYGWRHINVLDTDLDLLKWMDHAEIGDYHEHRLGVIVRLKDY